MLSKTNPVVGLVAPHLCYVRVPKAWSIIPALPLKGCLVTQTACPPMQAGAKEGEAGKPASQTGGKRLPGEHVFDPDFVAQFRQACSMLTGGKW